MYARKREHVTLNVTKVFRGKLRSRLNGQLVHATRGNPKNLITRTVAMFIREVAASISYLTISRVHYSEVLNLPEC
jgi:hypothetical protein